MKPHPNGPVSEETPRPTVHVQPTTYQPSKAELGEPVKISATPEEMARSVMQPVSVIADR